LEVPTGNKLHGFSNSYAALENADLLTKAGAAGISLGSFTDSIVQKIEVHQ
jgi:hypothetical protein